MKKLKEIFVSSFKKIWYAAIGGMGLGFFISLIVSIFTPLDVPGLLMLFIIIGGSVLTYFILDNNKFFDNV